VAFAVGSTQGLSEIVQVRCGLGHVPEETLRKLLACQDDEVAAAAAIGEWIFDPTTSVRQSLRSEWRRAVLRARKNDYSLGQILEKDPELSYEWLIAHVEDDRLSTDRDVSEMAEHAVVALATDKRTRLLDELREHPVQYKVVERLISDDLKVYQHMLQIQEFAAFHLTPLGDDPDERWDQRALAALTAGYAIEEVLSAAWPRAWSWSGHESAYWEKRASAFDALRSHSDGRIRQIASQAASAMRARMRDCQKRERIEAVYVGA
jgi:hypothetical protein